MEAFKWIVKPHRVTVLPRKCVNDVTLIPKYVIFIKGMILNFVQ